MQIAQENIKKGPLSTLPRVVPLLTSLHSQTIPFFKTGCFRTDWTFKQSAMCGLNGLLFNFSTDEWCLTLSKAFEKSIVKSRTASVIAAVI